MIRPAYLKQGDKVAIVCTARKFSEEEAKPAIDLLNSWGLEVVLGSTIGLDNFQLGGNDNERAADFNEQLADTDIKAIWCARGGYGTVRMIDMINFDLLLANPKWIIGFSDVTVLHSHVHNLGIETIHGIMAFSVARATEESKQSLYNALFGNTNNLKIESTQHNKLGKGEGEIIGGNLSILYSLLGSESSIDTTNKVLFIEDLDEYLYHIDRMMHNLKRNGKLANLQALIVGGMTDMHDNAIPFGYNAEQIITSIVSEYNYPVVFNYPAGHGVVNYAINFGREVEVEVTNEYSEVTFK